MGQRDIDLSPALTHLAATGEFSLSLYEDNKLKQGKLSFTMWLQIMSWHYLTVRL